MPSDSLVVSGIVKGSSSKIQKHRITLFIVSWISLLWVNHQIVQCTVEAMGALGHSHKHCVVDRTHLPLSSLLHSFPAKLRGIGVILCSLYNKKFYSI